MNLLLIEDEEAQLQMYIDKIEQFSKDHTIKITYDICKNYNDGAAALNTPHYDAAVIDLKLSGAEELEGRKLVEKVYTKIRIPIFINSGSIALIDDIPESALLKKSLRTDEFNNVLKQILAIYKTGLTSFIRPEGIIDEKLTQIFWTHLSKDIGIWTAHNNQNTLLRYILSHFAEYLDINMDGDFDEYHPFEVYIKPPIKKNIHTGDIVKYEDQLFLLLTPACDIVIQGYVDLADGKKQPIIRADNLILAKVKEFDYLKICKPKEKLDKSLIINYVKNNNYRYHYLPPFEENNGFIIDFQDISTVKYSNDIIRMASIAAPFIKDIISRFSIYYSRQGQPTFAQNGLVEKFYAEGNAIIAKENEERLKAEKAKPKN